MYFDMSIVVHYIFREIDLEDMDPRGWGVAMAAVDYNGGYSIRVLCQVQSAKYMKSQGG